MASDNFLTRCLAYPWLTQQHQLGIESCRPRLCAFLLLSPLCKTRRAVCWISIGLFCFDAADQLCPCLACGLCLFAPRFRLFEWTIWISRKLLSRLHAASVYHTGDSVGWKCSDDRAASLSLLPCLSQQVLSLNWRRISRQAGREQSEYRQMRKLFVGSRFLAHVSCLRQSTHLARKSHFG